MNNILHYLSKEESEKLIKSIPNIKHKLVILIMLDAGLRVSECCSLQLSNFDFKRKEIIIKSLKKRSKKEYRIVPMSSRLYECLAYFLQNIKNYSPTDYLFPGKGNRQYMGRSNVWKFCKKYARLCHIDSLHPHTLRHTFATHHLSSGTSLPAIKQMLGHKSYNTTLIYAEIPQDELRDNIQKVTQKPPTFLSKIFKRRRKNIKLINLDTTSSSVAIIGRNQEILKISEQAEKNINTILVGDIGCGKSCILNNIKTSKKILWLDSAESFKKSLVNILLYLYQDKNAVMSLIWKDFTEEEAKKYIMRDSVAGLTRLIFEATNKEDYLLIIDDITNTTPATRRGIEKLKDHFNIIASARYIKSNDTSFLWNFEKIEIKLLQRRDAMILINQLSAGLEVENWDAFRNHIFDNTNGNPRAISEMIDRYRKEPYLSLDVVREIRHSGSLREFDMTFIIVISLGCVMALRYMSGELDQPAFRFIGGVAMILLLMYRPLIQKIKKNHW